MSSWCPRVSLCVVIIFKDGPCLQPRPEGTRFYADSAKSTSRHRELDTITEHICCAASSNPSTAVCLYPFPPQNASSTISCPPNKAAPPFHSFRPPILIHNLRRTTHPHHKPPRAQYRPHPHSRAQSAVRAKCYIPCPSSDTSKRG